MKIFALLSAAFLVMAAVTIPETAFAETKPAPICALEQAELFSCPLESKTTVALCLSKDKLTTELVHVDRHGEKAVSPISDLKQALEPNAHGYVSILRGNAPEGVVTLFVDGDHYDVANPVLTTANGDLKNTEFCAGLKYNTPPTMVKINNELVSLNLFRLLEYGISQPLGEEPDWPEEKK